MRARARALVRACVHACARAHTHTHTYVRRDIRTALLVDVHTLDVVATHGAHMSARQAAGGRAGWRPGGGWGGEIPARGVTPEQVGDEPRLKYSFRFDSESLKVQQGWLARWPTP